MVRFILGPALKRLGALRSKAEKQTKELIEESMMPSTRKKLEGERTQTIQKIKDLKKEIEDNLPPGSPKPPGLAKGGAVISSGLSSLIRNYSQGPLARLDVPRETVPVQGMFEGGMPRNFNPFATGRELTEREEEVQAQMAAEALADDAPLPPIPLNQAQQQAYRSGLLQMDDLGYGRPENNEFLFLGDTSTETSGNVPNVTTVTQSQGTSGTGDTSPIEDGPVSPPPQQTIADAPLSDPTVPFTMPEVVEETTEQQTTTTQPTTQTTTTQPTQQTTTTTTQQPQQPVGTGRTPDQVMADRAAEEAAAAEAERIRLANLAAQEQLAAEQLAAQQQVAQDNLVPLPPVDPTPADTLDQELAQELADQATTQLAAQQNLDTQVLGAEQLVNQQAADRALLEAQLANQDDPTAVFQAPAPDTVDRSQFGVPVVPVDMSDPSVTYRTENNRLDSSHPFYQSEIFKNAPPYGTMDMYTASDGTEFGSSTTGALYEQWLQSQGVNPNVSFDVADKIDPYTTGYAPTLGMNIKETVYPYQGMTQEEMEKQGVYQAQVFQPMPKLSFGSGSQEGEEGEGDEETRELYPRLQFGSQKTTGKGRYVTNPVTGQPIFVPDYSGTRGPANLNTQNPESQPGEYGLKDEQQYQCPAYYTLAFEGGQPYCKKIDKSQWPSGGRRRSEVANLPSRTAVSIIELKEAGAETREGYAQGGPVQNFNYGGFVNRPSLQQQIQQAQRQGPFGQPLFQRFQNTGFVPPPQPQKSPGILSQLKQENPVSDSYYESPQFQDRMARAGQLMGVGPTPDVSMDSPIMDRMARGDIRTRGPESFGQMGPPQQIGQVAEPNTQQLASQLQNVTQQVNQLSSHLGVGGGGMSQGRPQLNQLQGGIGGLIQNLRPGPPPPQLRATGPVTPPMLQTTFIR